MTTSRMNITWSVKSDPPQDLRAPPLVIAVVGNDVPHIYILNPKPPQSSSANPFISRMTAASASATHDLGQTRNGSDPFNGLVPDEQFGSSVRNKSFVVIY